MKDGQHTDIFYDLLLGFHNAFGLITSESKIRDI